MVEPPKDAIFERLKHSVQLLASPAAIQLQLLPPFVCKADELALEFDHWQEVVLHNYGKQLSADQACAVKILKEKLHSLTLAGAEHWTDESVRNSPEWQNVRSLAADVLKVF